MLESLLPSFFSELEKLAAPRVRASTVYRHAKNIPAGELFEQGRQYRRRKKQKTAAMSVTQAKELVGAHHESPNWKAFEKNLNNQKFRQAVLTHPESDAKLKRYTKALGAYKTSKEVVGVVPSRTSSKLYKIKELPNGRLACSCKDWQYAHSHKPSKSADCEHIREFKGGVQ